MSNSGNGGEPSMEEILASIRALVSQDTAQPAAQPVAPPQSVQQSQQRPAPASSPIQGQDRSSPVAESRTELPHSAPSGAPASPARLDEDDLADLLDEPLPPVEQPVSAAGATPPFSADWSAGAGAAADRAVGSGSSAPAPMPFDFGAMVPSRDPAPARDIGGGSSLPPLSHTPAAARPMISPGATAANGSLSAGWSQPARKEQDAPLAANGLASPERPNPSPSVAAPSSPAPAAKSADIGAEPPAGKALDKPATEAAEADPSSSAAQQGVPNKFFSSPVATPPASSLSRPLVTRSEENASTALAQPAAEKNSGEAAIPAPEREARPSSAPSFLTRVPGVAQAPAKESAAAYPSIEPVLKAFGKPDTMADRPAPSSAPAPALESVNAPEKASRSNSSSSTAAPAFTPKAPEGNDGTEDSLGGRTLEDAVMHLLRPMLREWLDDNLPRIVEEAVRREIAEAVKSKIGQVPKL